MAELIRDSFSAAFFDFFVGGRLALRDLDLVDILHVFEVADIKSGHQGEGDA